MEQSHSHTSNPPSDPQSTPTPDIDPGNPSQSIGDRARDIAGVTRDRLADVGSTVRDRAGTIKDSLADALESGADRLRNRTPGGPGGVALAGQPGAASAALTEDGRVGHATQKVAGGMDATANWLRDADLDSLKATVERQVKEHPGRSLLIAVGVGYLLGKALRK